VAQDIVEWCDAHRSVSNESHQEAPGRSRGPLAVLREAGLARKTGRDSNNDAVLAELAAN
jgi:hypothetical protein